MTTTEQVSGRRFIIIGLPRSGTTYLMTLLNSHKKILCAGELFNPYSVIETGPADFDPVVISNRDLAPRQFLQQFFERHERESWDRIGFKMMLGHSLRVLTHLPDVPDVPIIYVYRENRLAQVASLLKAVQTKTWAQTARSREMKVKIVASPQQISQQWHEYATMDFLFSQWFKSLAHRKMTVEYRDLFKPDFNGRVCDFLQVSHDPKMKSSLVKQGANRVIDRFKDAGHIEAYMRYIGRGSWLEDELT
ncbi:MAG: Stf0 family sulfotransferase [Paracoccaceae bacterium]